MARAATGLSHTLTLDDEGTVWSFGWNNYGQCGINNNKKDVTKPTKVPGLPVIVAIAAGDDFSACVDIEGHVWTFGSGSYGQLGHGEPKNNKYTPTKVPRLNDIVSVSCGCNHTMCITSKGSVYAFGFNYYGALGTDLPSNAYVYEGWILGAPTSFSPTPLVVNIDENIKQIACGEKHSVFLTVSGDVWVCGENEEGVLGMENLTKIYTPVKNPYLSDIVSISCGSNHTVAMNSEHQLFSFGVNNKGQLCSSDDENRNYPEEIEFPAGVQWFSCSNLCTIILDASNRVWVFGMYDLEGDRKEGYHDGIMFEQPSNVCQLSSGRGNRALLKTTSNEIWAFGNNNYHEIPLPIPKGLGEYDCNIVTKPKQIPSEYSHIMGTSNQSSSS